MKIGWKYRKEIQNEIDNPFNLCAISFGFIGERWVSLSLSQFDLRLLNSFPNLAETFWNSKAFGETPEKTAETADFGNDKDSKYRAFPAARKDFDFNNIVGSFRPKKDAFGAKESGSKESFGAKELREQLNSKEFREQLGSKVSALAKEENKQDCALQQSLTSRVAEYLTKVYNEIKHAIAQLIKLLKNFFNDNPDFWFFENCKHHRSPM